MASYFHLTLDTAAPSGVALEINHGALYATSTAVNLDIAVADEQTEGYQMKLWGVSSVEGEDAASWERFSTSKQVTLPQGDGRKTIYLKVRDDVGNESVAVSASITLNTAVPVVNLTGPDRSKISKTAGFEQAVIHFACNMDFEAYKVCVVPTASSEQQAGTVIPTEYGSINTSGTEGGYPAETNIRVVLTGADLESASSGDGTKIIKVFVRSAAGTWSVA